MPPSGDNPYDDGLDFVGCPPRPTRLVLPAFPESFDQDCSLICWARLLPIPDGVRRMRVEIDEFKPTAKCSVYKGFVRFVDEATDHVWYKGELLFHYTRNYAPPPSGLEKKPREIVFRFVVKGDIERVAEDMPEWECLILCTKPSEEVRYYDKIFVYGGLDILYDVDDDKMIDFRLGVGHNDGWYTHHPNCSARPIIWTGEGDYIGHYCERGWLFVSPARNFVFDPGLRPPTGRFFEEALRSVRSQCYTEEAIRWGAFGLAAIEFIHSYQNLRGRTECDTLFVSTEFCQGLVYVGALRPWITFFSMGYWRDAFKRKEQILHLVEGSIKLDKEEFEGYKRGPYFYGFSTQNPRVSRKLVDLASNRDVIGEPVDTDLLIYLYNAGRMLPDPLVRDPLPIDPKLARRLLRDDILSIKERESCRFLDQPGTPQQAS